MFAGTCHDWGRVGIFLSGCLDRKDMDGISSLLIILEIWIVDYDQIHWEKAPGPLGEMTLR